MKKTLILGSIISAVFLTGCATPVTTLKNQKTGEVVQCGGGYVGSIVGGMTGYTREKQNDGDCIAKYVALGYDPL